MSIQIIAVIIFCYPFVIMYAIYNVLQSIICSAGGGGTLNFDIY